MINKILADIKVITYGRDSKGVNWSFSEKIGVNRIYYIHSGTGTFTNGNSVLKLEPGYLYLFPQSLEFNTKADDGVSVDHTFFDFYLPSYISTNAIKIKKDCNSLINYTSNILINIAENNPMYKALKRNDYYDSVTTLIANFIFFLSNQCETIKFIDDFRLLHVLSHIKSNLHNPISIKQLAEIVGLEENAFTNLFRKNMNITPHKYIKQYRLNIGISLIQSGFSVSDAAIAVGYESVGGFTNAIKEYTGYTASQIKKLR